MPLETDIKAVRDLVVSTTIATWTDANVTHEDPQMVLTPPVAWVRMGKPEYEPETVRSEAAILTFTIHGRWASLTDDQRIDKASQLRTALLTLGTFDGVAYMTDANEFTGFDEDNMLDPYTEVGVLFMCRISVPRA